MPFVSVPKDLTKIKTKVALNLTKRQLICFSMAGAVGIPTYLFTKGSIGSDISVLLMIGLMLPFFFFAMYERDGQPAEKIARNWLRAKLWPGTRPYQTNNLYSYLQREGTKLAKNKTTSKAGAAASNSRHTGKKGSAGAAGPAQQS